MSGPTHPSASAAEASYQWIVTYLNSFDGDLLEFELDVDSQHFFDPLDVLSVKPSPRDHRRSPLQLTPSVFSAISDFHDPWMILDEQSAMPSPSVSFCDLLQEAQVTASCQHQAFGQAVTTPRKPQARTLRHRHLTATAAPAVTIPFTKPPTRSSSRKRLNRRLFQ